ncbi:hypothetical protein, partial [uncultured Planktosalinus sp.]|uniref:hypothetical protein n=1 Tax=uncultured Planktosalinus sp. TaxID=1810935 RepID=UPI0030DD8748
MVAKKKKDEFVDLSYTESTLINELSKKLSKNQHLYLIINTDKVLIRKIPNSSNKNNQLSNAFPGLNYSEFYYNILTTDKNSFIAICRKDYVHSLIETFSKEKIEVIGFELGFASLNIIIPSLGESSIETNKFQFDIENGQIQNFDEITQKSLALYRIDTIEVPS